MGALHAAQKAVARAPSDRDWWIRLSNWAREAHARSSSTSTQQYIEAARTAMQHARTLEASAPGSWVQRLDEELQTALETALQTALETALVTALETELQTALETALVTAGATAGATAGKAQEACDAQPITVESAFPSIGGEGGGTAAQLERCTVIEASDLAAALPRLVGARHGARRPFIVRNSTRELTDVAHWTTASLQSLVGEVLVEAAFTTPEGELNTFEPLSAWQDWFAANRFAFAQGVEGVLVRPIQKVLRMRQLFALWRSGATSAAGVNGRPYLHQSELHLNLPSLLALISAPAWASRQPNWLPKETNLWLSAGDTMTSLHQDTTENIMAQVRGTKEFLLFAPEEKDHLYYQRVMEVARNSRETGNIFVGKTGRGDSANHGLVNVRKPDLVKHPLYASARGLRCRIGPGDALYVPGEWHHAVYSSCSKAERAAEAACNVGLNYWYVDVTRKGALQTG